VERIFPAATQCCGADRDEPLPFDQDALLRQLELLDPTPTESSKRSAGRCSGHHRRLDPRHSAVADTNRLGEFLHALSGHRPARLIGPPSRY
jgi:hypothetical protein